MTLCNIFLHASKCCNNWGSCPQWLNLVWNFGSIRAFMQLDESIKAKMNPPSSAQEFCKTTLCPSSEKLLRYRRRRLPIKDRHAISAHLRSCDFCSAEIELLKRHRNEAEELRAAEMPSHL